MNSIRMRLFAILLLTTGAMWFSAIAWIYTSTRNEVERVLDARLTEAARMVSSLITDHRVAASAAADAATAEPEGFAKATASYERQLSCQIWSLEGNLVGRSESAPTTSLANHASGFAETVIKGEKWRVYAVINRALGVRVLVGDSVAMRDRLVSDVAKGLLLPALLILPLLAILIWLSVGRGLAPLNSLANILSKRDEKELHPLADIHAPKEIRPVIASLNGLFDRVADARERERNFTAYAAHELKTPLAGLKTQAQIALRAPDTSTQQAALQHIISSVDRTSRMVKQLIDLAAADSAEAEKNVDTVDLVSLMADITRELQVTANLKKVSIIGPGIERMVVENTNSALLRLAFRNVLENAIQHSAEGETVQCTLHSASNGFGVSISDQGPGIKRDDYERVTERFYRGGENSHGSGLGLSIVSMVVERLQGTLSFEKTERFTVHLKFPSYVANSDRKLNHAPPRSVAQT